MTSLEKMFKSGLLEIIALRIGIHRQLEWETPKWVGWYNTQRLHSAIGYLTPDEAVEAFYENLNTLEKAALVLNNPLSGTECK